MRKNVEIRIIGRVRDVFKAFFNYLQNTEMWANGAAL